MIPSKLMPTSKAYFELMMVSQWKIVKKSYPDCLPLVFALLLLLVGLHVITTVITAIKNHAKGFKRHGYISSCGLFDYDRETSHRTTATYDTNSTRSNRYCENSCDVITVAISQFIRLSSVGLLLLFY
eukprot:TRINITY_DN9365_c0_g1_i3.p1 TRINITY_DN9365_c0_g1~~TRINITY_DN9365_c0_g1_i3.p1  ORF type:complete len:128 (+),score=4.61 TRINITY_DN9365_c0_g1_i3:163-546(+)